MKRGFGTNFHKVYKESAELYESFSSAEIFSDQLMVRFKELFFGNVLLDVACGTCNKTFLFSKFFKKNYALDNSKVFLNYAKDKYTDDKITYLYSSANKIPLLDKSVDTIIITWGSFPLLSTIKEMKRVLKPGGVILRIGAVEKDEFTSLFPSFDLLRIKRIIKTFEKNGFSSEKHFVDINFNNLSTAKSVLSKITGASSELIINNKLKHKVVLNIFKNDKL